MAEEDDDCTSVGKEGGERDTNAGFGYDREGRGAGYLRRGGESPFVLNVRTCKWCSFGNAGTSMHVTRFRKNLGRRTG